jgi:BolA protein
MTSDARIEKLKSRLQEALAPAQLEIVDETARHAGHAGAASGGGHYILHIVASAFEDKSPVQRHRLVFDAVGDMMHNDIHALSIQAKAPGEL